MAPLQFAADRLVFAQQQDPERLPRRHVLTVLRGRGDALIPFLKATPQAVAIRHGLHRRAP